MDRATFTVQLRDALAHLHDLPYRPRHPLTILVADARGDRAGAALHALLVRAIEELRPATALPIDSPMWRRYRLLQLRYLNRESAQHAAEILTVSERQARREHHEALQALTALLWSRLSVPDVESPPDTAGLRPGTDSSVTADVGEVLAGVSETLRPLLAERSIALEINLPDSLPRTTVARVGLRQALLALIVEAVDLGCRRISVDASETAGNVQLDTRFRGHMVVHLKSSPPIARDLIERDTTVGKGGGTLVIHSQPHGEDVAFTLPKAGATILLVDDDPDFARLFRRCLVGTCYTLRTSWQAEEALAQAAAFPPDIIILDVLMPSLDGWELLQRFKQMARTSAIPILICSVLHEQSLARALGAVDYLPKPVTPRALLAALDRCRSAAPRPAHPDMTAGSEGHPSWAGRRDV